MAGHRVDVAKLTSAGIDGDRRWALRSTETGMIVSAKRPKKYGELLNWSATTGDDGVPDVTSPNGEQFEAGSTELDATLSEALGEPVQVVLVEPGAEETYDTEWPTIPDTALSDVEMVLPLAMATEKASFVDLAGLHLILEDSLRKLNDMVESEVVVERFRPSIVLRRTSGSTPESIEDSALFEEVEWSEQSATIGGASVHISHAAPRCVMTTVAQGALGPARDILATLAAESRKELAFGAFACFGTYAEVTTAGPIAVGDRFDFVT